MDSPDTSPVKSVRKVGDVVNPTHNCGICFDICDQQSYIDACLHAFCYACIVKWSRRRSVCPLCMRPFDSVIHNFRNMNDFDKTILKFNGLKFIFLHPFKKIKEDDSSSLSSEDASGIDQNAATSSEDESLVNPEDSSLTVTPGTLYLFQEYGQMLRFPKSSKETHKIPIMSPGNASFHQAFKEVRIIRAKQADTGVGILADKVGINVLFRGNHPINVVLQAPEYPIYAADCHDTSYMSRDLLQRIRTPADPTTMQVEVQFHAPSDSYISTCRLIRREPSHSPRQSRPRERPYNANTIRLSYSPPQHPNPLHQNDPSIFPPQSSNTVTNSYPAAPHPSTLDQREPAIWPPQTSNTLRISFPRANHRSTLDQEEPSIFPPQSSNTVTNSYPAAPHRSTLDQSELAICPPQTCNTLRISFPRANHRSTLDQGEPSIFPPQTSNTVTNSYPAAPHRSTLDQREPAIYPPQTSNTLRISFPRANHRSTLDQGEPSIFPPQTSNTVTNSYPAAPHHSTLDQREPAICPPQIPNTLRISFPAAPHRSTLDQGEPSIFPPQSELVTVSYPRANIHRSILVPRETVAAYHNPNNTPFISISYSRSQNSNTSPPSAPSDNPPQN